MPPNISGRPPAAYTLNLSRVLTIADAQNPNVAVARERINEAYARVERAQVLWLPSIRTGLHYDHHEGPLQNAEGDIINVNKSTLYGGLGTNVTGAGTVAIPGVSAQFHTADAIFQPRIAEDQAMSRRYGATAVRNDTLRNTAIAYLELVRAEQTVAIAEEAQTNTRSLSSLTESYARTGQGLRSDDERVRAELVQRELDVVRQTEQIQVASARLAQLLHSDPSVLIGSGEPVVTPIELFKQDCTEASLISSGLMRRPELAEQRYLVSEACERLNREKYAPLVPSVLLGMSYGGFGGGLGGTIGNGDGRFDGDAIAFWEVRNLGFGERAARNEASSVARQAQYRQVALLDQVAREVSEANAQVLQRKKRIAIAQDGIEAAEKSLKLNLDRIQNAQGLPIEALQAVQALAAARVAYLNAVVDFNIAQFELCRATGWFMQGM
ncbi:MAG TPA: TolC family protein [Caulifigura sp.]|nr:TolC family protein [Caulifigura sp.]